jgi:hypothetical protein
MRQTLRIAALAAIVLLLARCKPAVADAAPAPHDVTVAVLASSADSLRYRIAWSAVSDANGAADHYVDSVFVGGALAHAEVTANLADTVTVKRPAAGASISLALHLRAIRRTISGPAFTQSWTYTQSDVAPAAPSGVTVDTLAMVFPAVSAVLPSGFAALPGDSVLVRAVALLSNGDTVTPTGTIRWSVGDTSRQLIHPVPGTATAWAIRKPVT